MLFILFAYSLQAVKPLPEDLSPYAEAYENAAADLNVSDPIPEILRSVWSEDEVFSQVRGTFGMSVLRLYVAKDTDEIFVIAGDRFGLGQLKITVGGQIDPEDQTVAQTYHRELEEEYFGQLLDREVQPLPLEGRVTRITGGVFKDGEIWKTHGWGPCIGWVQWESGYTKEELQEAIKIMNENAGLHVAVADFFHDFEKKTPEEKKGEAQALLAGFEASKSETTVPLTKVAADYLRQLTETPEAPFPEGSGKTGFEFAQKHVHAYTEYKSFYLLPLKKWWTFMQREQGISGERAVDFDVKNGAPEEVRGLEDVFQGKSLFTRFDADRCFYDLMQKNPEVFSSPGN